MSTSDETALQDLKIEQEKAWAEAQASRAHTLPADVLAAAGPDAYGLPGEFVERSTGLYITDEEGELRKVSNCWIRYIGPVLNLLLRKIVLRLIAVAAPTSQPSDKPEWRIVELTGDDTITAKSFCRRLREHGEFNFTGKDHVLSTYFEASQDRPEFKVLPAWGRVDYAGFTEFAFANALVSKQGVEKRNVLELRVAMIAGMPVYIDNRLSADENLPRLSVPYALTSKTLGEYLKYVGKFFKLPGLLAIAWAFAGLSRAKFMTAVGAFPILLAVGTRSSGKTTLLNALASMFGTGKLGLSAGETTEAGLRRRLSKVASLPLRLDDLRPDAARRFSAALLAMFGETGSARASRDGMWETVESRPLSNVMVAAETVPQDIAAVSRCVVIDLPLPAKEQGESLDVSKLNALAAAAGAFLLTTVDRAHDEQLAEMADALGKGLVNVEDRQRRQVWGPILAGLKKLYLLAGVKPDKLAQPMDAATKYALEQIRVHSGKGWVDTFFEDLVAMINSESLEVSAMFFKYSEADKHLWFNLVGLFALWREWRRKGGYEVFYTVADMRRDIRSQDWNIKDKKKKVRYGNRTWHAMGINLALAVPQGVNLLVECIRQDLNMPPPA